jgi:hypothetical protein
MSMYTAKDRKNILDKILREDIQIWRIVNLQSDAFVYQRLTYALASQGLAD